MQHTSDYKVLICHLAQLLGCIVHRITGATSFRLNRADLVSPRLGARRIRSLETAQTTQTVTQGKGLQWGRLHPPTHSSAASSVSELPSQRRQSYWDQRHHFDTHPACENTLGKTVIL